jgi:hypothetical protein
MSTHSARGLVTMVLLGLVLAFGAGQAVAAILVPAGTPVGLSFLTPLNSTTAKLGDKVRFNVTANVIESQYVVIKQGTTLTGTVNEAGHPALQNNSYANISFLAVNGADGKPVRLKDIRVSAGLFGGHLQVEPGAFVQTTTLADAMVSFR